MAENSPLNHRINREFNFFGNKEFSDETHKKKSFSIDVDSISYGIWGFFTQINVRLRWKHECSGKKINLLTHCLKCDLHIF